MVGTVLMCVCACVEFVKCNKVCVLTGRSLCQNELVDDTSPYSSLKCWDMLCLFTCFVYSFFMCWLDVFATNIILSYKKVFTDTTMI